MPFRTGNSKNQLTEVIHNALNQDRGSAIDIDEGSFIWYENLGLAKALADEYETARRFANQFNPNTLGPFLERWETIMNIVPNPNDSIETRRNRIANRFLLWTQPSTIDNVITQIKDALGDIFIDLEYYDPNLDLGSCPGGLDLSSVGGVILPDGNWQSQNCTIRIRIWQPRDNQNNLLMDNATFINTKQLANNFLTNYLPAYTNFQLLQFITQGSGTVTGIIGSNILYGTNTSFTITFQINDLIEIVDDSNNIHTYQISSIPGDTRIIIYSSLLGNSTNNYYRVPPRSGGGFILDTPNNLDRMRFRR